jgi:hypothetical protein
MSPSRERKVNAKEVQAQAEEEELAGGGVQVAVAVGGWVGVRVVEVEERGAEEVAGEEEEGYGVEDWEEVAVREGD